MAKSAINLSLITLSEVSFLECAIIQNGPDLVALSDSKNINLEIRTEFSFSRDNNYLSIRLRLHAQPVDEEGQIMPLSARFNIHFGFIVRNLNELLVTSDDGEHVPDFMLTLSLVSIAYSTSRGMILGKVAGTAFEGYGLPLMDARELLEYASDDVRVHKEPTHRPNSAKAQQELAAESTIKPKTKRTKK
jgi:hypothetical protein